MFVVLLLTIAYEPKAIFFCHIYTFGITSTIFYRIEVSDTPYLNGNIFSKSTATSISDAIIRLVYILNVTVLQVSLAPGSKYVPNVLMLK